jgi:transcriptional regulator with XRE-family HTH domain
VDDSVSRVATRIKHWRSEASLSLQQLANRSGVSPSTIHKIEHHQTVPTIAVVLKLAAGLGRHATELFDEEDGTSSTIHIRAGDRVGLITPHGARVEALSADLDTTEIGLWRMVQPPGFSFGNHASGKVAGELILFLEEGHLDVTIGERSYSLDAGDSLHFEASSAYEWKNSSDRPVSILLTGNLAGGLRPSLVAQMRRVGTPPRVSVESERDYRVSLAAAEA